MCILTEPRDAEMFIANSNIKFYYLYYLQFLFFNKPCSCPCFIRLHSLQYNNIFTMLRARVPTGARDELDEGLSTL